MVQTENVHRLHSVPVEVICVGDKWVPREVLADCVEKVSLNIEASAFSPFPNTKKQKIIENCGVFFSSQGWQVSKTDL